MERIQTRCAFQTSSTNRHSSVLFRFFNCKADELAFTRNRQGIRIEITFRYRIWDGFEFLPGSEQKRIFHNASTKGCVSHGLLFTSMTSDRKIESNVISKISRERAQKSSFQILSISKKTRNSTRSSDEFKRLCDLTINTLQTAFLFFFINHPWSTGSTSFAVKQTAESTRHEVNSSASLEIFASIFLARKRCIVEH